MPPAGASLVRVVHPFPSLLVAALTAALIPFADANAGPALYLTLGGGMLCFQFAIGLVNDVVDREADRQVKPWKAIPRGLVPWRAAAVLAGTLGGAGLVVTSWLPMGAWLVGAAGLGCGLAYDVVLKRTALSWLPFAVAFPLLPAWVFLAADAWDPLLWWAFPLGGMLGLALHLANQAPDAGGPGTGLPGVLGEARSRALGLGLFGLASGLAVAVLWFESVERALAAAALAAAAGTVGRTVAPRLGRDGLFGVLAAASAGLAALFVSAA